MEEWKNEGSEGLKGEREEWKNGGGREAGGREKEWTDWTV